MTACRYDRDRDEYLTDGEPCRHDEHGDPTFHCTAKQRCSQHIGRTDLTCARCISDTRQNLRWIPDLASLLPVEALDDGANSEAMVLAGPAADYATLSARRALDRLWIYRNIPARHLAQAVKALLPEEDDRHPYSVLTRWHLMLAEDYGHPLPGRMSVGDSAAYLDRQLHRLAQDPGQDFALFRREIRDCRDHLEAVLHNGTADERGAPCPDCVADGGVDPAKVRLRREYGHWCMDPDCCQVHYLTDEADRWLCPVDRAHWWLEADYRRWIEERTGGRAS